MRRLAALAWVGVFAMLAAGCAEAPATRASLLEGGLDAESRGDLDEAVADLRAAVSLNPDDPVAGEALGALFLRRGWVSSAAQQWQRTLKGCVAPGCPRSSAQRGALDRAREGLLKIRLARGAFDEGQARWAEAAAAYRQALALAPESEAAWVGLAGASAQQGDQAQAFRAYARCFALMPEDADVAMGYGLAAHAVGSQAQAVEAFSRCVALKPMDAVAWNDLGVAQVEAGHAADGLESFKRALALKPDMAASLDGEAAALYDLRRYPEARALWARALDKNPDDATAVRDIANLVRMGY